MTATTGNNREMYNDIKKVFRPLQSKTAPLRSSTKEIITDKNKKMERWMDHYSRQNTGTPTTLDAINCLPTITEIDVLPTTDELSH